MSQFYLRQTVMVPGVVLYSLLFMYAHSCWLNTGNSALHSQPELLLFLLPGALMALLHADSPLKSTLSMACWGTFFSTILLYSTSLTQTSGVNMVVWCLSTVFWAGNGALLVRLLHIVWQKWQIKPQSD